MNYAIVIMVFVGIISMLYWYVAGRHYYYGPRVRAHLVDGEIVNDESESGEEREGKKIAAP